MISWYEAKSLGWTWKKWSDHKYATKALKSARKAKMDRSKVHGPHFHYGTNVPMDFVKSRARMKISDFGGHGYIPSPPPKPYQGLRSSKAAVAKLKRKALIERNRQAALKRQRERKILVPKHVIDLTK
jgi:hypothetical protein